MSIELLERYQGCLIGLAVGDAIGTTVEFRPRGSFEALTDMVGGGPFNLKPGQWTDDTSMALCLAESLIEKKGFEPRDQMDRYLKWYREGYLSSTGTCFDIGGTTATALRMYEKTGNPFSGSTDPHSSGNGSIMRLAPVPLFFFPNKEAMIIYSAESSRTTHGSKECIDACRLFASVLFNALSGMDKERVLFDHEEQLVKEPNIRGIARGLYRDKAEDHIKGSGYVVKSLEAALWCFLTTDSYVDAVLKAVNLGDDADTTSAICGQVAGAYYGLSDIPGKWLRCLSKRDGIQSVAVRLLEKQSVEESV